jgi:signal transduction histidine kinase
MAPQATVGAARRRKDRLTSDVMRLSQAREADDNPPRWRPWRDLSIRVKLPLGIVLLLAAASAALTASAFLRVRASVVGTASDRLFRAATQLSDIIGKSAEARAAVLQKVAHAPVLQTYLQDPGDSQRAPLLATLTTVARTGGTAELGLFDTTGRRLLATGETLRTFPGGEAVATLAANPAGTAISPLQRDADGVFYTMTIGVSDGTAPRGYLVERRLTGGANGTTDVISGLIGTEAQLTFGNGRGDVWTGFPVPAFPGPAALHGAVVATAGPQALLTRIAPIPGTPWVSGVGFPMAPVMEPVRRFLLEALAITALITALGALVGWAGSRRLTLPLARVADAAEAIASAQPAPALEFDRRDEVGRLAISFNQMARRVTESREQLEQLVNDLEQRVRLRTSALEQANGELEAFSYSVSHDLRAPLRAVTGFATILVEDHGPSLSPAARECVDVIARRARHMGQLIDDLLAFSRLGRATISREAIDMTALARRVADDVGRADPGRTIAFDIADLPAASGEPSLIQQVLVNLIQNAAKFTRTRPEAVIAVAIADTPRGAAYVVRDNGVGFDMRYADRLFGVFQRLHRQDEFEGTGVGLAIVRRIVERHGGAVWAEAGPDRGATFFFTLPPLDKESAS